MSASASSTAERQAPTTVAEAVRLYYPLTIGRVLMGVVRFKVWLVIVALCAYVGYEAARSGVATALPTPHRVRGEDPADLVFLAVDWIVRTAIPVITGIVTARLGVKLLGLVHNLPLRVLGRPGERHVLERADREFGWRPRTGAPHPEGRDDTYGRWTPEVDEMDGLVVFQLQPWSYTAMAGWQPDGDRITLARVDPEDAETLGTTQAELEDAAEQRNREAEQQWLAAREKRRAHELEMSAEAERQLERQGRARDMATHIRKRLNS